MWKVINQAASHVEQIDFKYAYHNDHQYYFHSLIVLH